VISDVNNSDFVHYAQFTRSSDREAPSIDDDAMEAGNCIAPLLSCWPSKTYRLRRGLINGLGGAERAPSMCGILDLGIRDAFAPDIVFSFQRRAFIGISSYEFRKSGIRSAKKPGGLLMVANAEGCQRAS
jgi:hypothetical protein